VVVLTALWGGDSKDEGHSLLCRQGIARTEADGAILLYHKEQADCLASVRLRFERLAASDDSVEP